MHPSTAPKSSLEISVLLTVLYSDLFDHALTDEELKCYLVEAVEQQGLRAAVESLGRHGWLERREGHVVLAGRSDLIALRQKRRDRSAELWRQARRVADWLAEIPFLRMVGVCGSLAVENVPEDGDIDFFLVTDNDRLWIVQWQAMRLRRRAAREGIDACPNYLVTLDNLEVSRRDLHMAREIAHVVPLWGEPVYDRFLAANEWIFDLLPNLDLGDRKRWLYEPRPSRRSAGREQRLHGLGGDLLDRALYRLLLLYYPWRLRSRGVKAEQIRAAYRRDRQEVVGGGYAAAIRDRFAGEVEERLGEEALLFVDQRLFPGRDGGARAVALYGRQLTERYGGRA